MDYNYTKTGYIQTAVLFVNEITMEQRYTYPKH